LTHDEASEACSDECEKDEFGVEDHDKGLGVVVLEEG
jgi:hypothetical protein